MKIKLDAKLVVNDTACVFTQIRIYQRAVFFCAEEEKRLICGLVSYGAVKAIELSSGSDIIIFIIFPIVQTVFHLPFFMLFQGSSQCLADRDGSGTGSRFRGTQIPVLLRMLYQYPVNGERSGLQINSIPGKTCTFCNAQSRVVTDQKDDAVVVPLLKVI